VKIKSQKHDMFTDPHPSHWRRKMLWQKNI